MKRAAMTSALTLAGVLSAGGAAALVNSRILDSGDGGAAPTNRVELVEAQRLLGPRPVTTTAPGTDPPTTPPATSDVAASTAAVPPGTDEEPIAEGATGAARDVPDDPPRTTPPGTHLFGDAGARDPGYPSTTTAATPATVAPGTAPPRTTVAAPTPPVTSTPPATSTTTASAAHPTSTATSVSRRPSWPPHAPSTWAPHWPADD
jgi:hypothetical protein